MYIPAHFRESNLEVMNQLIKQSWIAGTPEAAECFLDWYFELPVYTLRYSNNRKAIEGIRELFVSEECPSTSLRVTKNEKRRI